MSAIRAKYSARTAAKCETCGDVSWKDINEHGSCKTKANLTAKADALVRDGTARHLVDIRVHVEDVLEHVAYVNKAARVLYGRSFPQHDASKFSDAEAVPYTLMMFLNIKSESWDSALQHHYDCNSHHVQHHGESVMPLEDIQELICDNIAVVCGRKTLRGKPNPDYGKSIQDTLGLVLEQFKDENNFIHKQLGHQLPRVLAEAKAVHARMAKSSKTLVHACPQAGCTVVCKTLKAVVNHGHSAHGLACVFCHTDGHTKTCPTQALFGCSFQGCKMTYPDKLRADNHAANSHPKGQAETVILKLVENQSDTRGPPVQELIEAGKGGAAHIGATVPALANAMVGWSANVNEMSTHWQELEKGVISPTDSSGKIIFQTSYMDRDMLGPYAKFLALHHKYAFGPHHFKILIYGASVQSGSIIAGVQSSEDALRPTSPAEIALWGNFQRLAFNQQGAIEFTLDLSGPSMAAQTSFTNPGLKQWLTVMVDEIPLNTIGVSDTSVRYTIFHKLGDGAGFHYPDVAKIVSTVSAASKTPEILDAAASIDLKEIIGTSSVWVITDGTMYARTDTGRRHTSVSHHTTPEHNGAFAEASGVGQANAYGQFDNDEFRVRNSGSLSYIDPARYNDSTNIPELADRPSDYEAVIAQEPGRNLQITGWGPYVNHLWHGEPGERDWIAYNKTITAFKLNDVDAYSHLLVPGAVVQFSPPRSDLMAVATGVQEQLPVLGETPWTAKIMDILQTKFKGDVAFNLVSDGDTIGEAVYDSRKRIIVANAIAYGHLALSATKLSLTGFRPVQEQYFLRRWPDILTSRTLSNQASLSAVVAAGAIGAGSSAGDTILGGRQQRKTMGKKQDFFADQLDMNREFQKELLKYDVGAGLIDTGAKAKAANALTSASYARSNANMASSSSASMYSRDASTTVGEDEPSEPVPFRDDASIASGDTDYYSLNGDADLADADPGGKVLTGKSSRWTSQGTEQTASGRTARTYENGVKNRPNNKAGPVQMKDAEISATPHDKSMYSYNVGVGEPAYATKEYPSGSGPGQTVPVSSGGTQTDFEVNPPSTSEEAAAQTEAGKIPVPKTAFVSGGVYDSSRA